MGLSSFSLMGMHLTIETGETVQNQDSETITCPKCNQEKPRAAMETLRCKHQICQTCFLTIIRRARTDTTVTLCCPTCNATFFSRDIVHEESKAPQEPEEREYDSERDDENEEGFRTLLMGLMMNFVDAL